MRESKYNQEHLDYQEIGMEHTPISFKPIAVRKLNLAKSVGCSLIEMSRVLHSCGGLGFCACAVQLSVLEFALFHGAILLLQRSKAARHTVFPVAFVASSRGRQASCKTVQSALIPIAAIPMPTLCSQKPESIWYARLRSIGTHACVTSGDCLLSATIEIETLEQFKHLLFP